LDTAGCGTPAQPVSDLHRLFAVAAQLLERGAAVGSAKAEKAYSLQRA
jgi:hypothetical protein